MDVKKITYEQNENFDKEIETIKRTRKKSGPKKLNN